MAERNEKLNAAQQANPHHELYRGAGFSLFGLNFFAGFSQPTVELIS